MLQPKIFLSYSWANNTVANEIDSYFQKYGISLIRDVRDAAYRTDLREYMGRIQETDYVIMLIGHDFLTSENCMFEMLKMISIKNFEQRILPVNIGDAKFYNPKQRTVYYQLWDERIAETKKLAIEYETTDFAVQLKHQKDIRNNLAEFFTRITAMNLSLFDDLKRQRYQPIFKILGYSDMDFLGKLIQATEISSVDLMLTELERLTSQYGPSFLINFQKAVIYKRDGKINLSRMFFSKAILDKPMYPNLYNDYGILLQHEFGDFEDARAAYEFALKIDPRHEAATLNLTYLIEKHDHNIHQARKLWEEAIAAHPDNLKFKVNLAALLVDQTQDYELALKYYEDALTGNPQYDKALNGIARLLADKLDRKKDAVAFYERALKVSPVDHLYIDLLTLLESLNEQEKLKEIINDAVKAAPTSNVFLKCAELESGLFKNLAQAKTYYLKAIRADYKNARVYNVYGAFLEYQLKDYPLARRAYENALRLMPENPVYNYNYGYLVDVHFKDFTLARHHYEQSLHSDPAQFDSNLNLGELLIRHSYEADGIPYLEKAIEADPKNPMPYRNLAYHYMNEEPLKAKAMFKELLRYDPDRDDDRAAYGQVLAGLGELKEARVQFDQAMVKGDDPEAIMRYLTYLVNSKQLEAAENLTKRFMAQYPDESFPFVNYSTVLIILKRIDEAEKILLEVIKKHGDLPDAHYNLSVVYESKGNEQLRQRHFELARENGIEAYIP